MTADFAFFTFALAFFFFALSPLAFLAFALAFFRAPAARDCFAFAASQAPVSGDGGVLAGGVTGGVAGGVGGGAVTETVKVWLAGEASTLPTASIARTEKV